MEDKANGVNILERDRWEKKRKKGSKGENNVLNLMHIFAWAGK